VHRHAEPRLVRIGTPDGELFLPMAIERGRFGVRLLGFPDGGLADHAAPIVARGATPVPAASWPALARRIARQAGADVLDWRHLTPRVSRQDNPLYGPACRRTPYSTHALALTGSWQDFCRDRLSTSHLATSRRKWRQLGQSGSARFVIARTVDEALGLLETTVRLKTAQCADTGSRNLLAQAAYRDFFTRMTRRHLASGLVRVAALQIDDTVLATHWGCVHRGRFVWLMPAYDPAWHRVSPGRLLLEHLLQRCFDDGLDAFDFTIGDEPYKAVYADAHERLGRVCHARTPLGHAYAFRARREGLPPDA